MDHEQTPPPDPRDAARRAFIRLGTTGFLAVQPSLELLAAAQGPAQGRPAPNLRGIRALVFDTFGTVVDWRASVIDEVEQLARSKKLTVDGAAFADGWRAGYAPAMNRVRTGDLPWTPFGFQSHAGPFFDQLGPPGFISLAWAFVVVCLLDLLAAALLWRGRRRGAWLGAAMTPVTLVFALGFAFPFLLAALPLRLLLLVAARSGLR